MATTTVSTMGELVPYITTDELKREPIFNQLRRLTPNSTPADLDAQLGQIIRGISSQINSECGQNLVATLDEEVGEVVVQPNGSVRLHTRATPVVQVLSIAIGPTIDNLSAMSDLTGLVLEPWRITVPSSRMPWRGRPGMRLWAHWTYLNGFPVTTLAVAASAGDTSITVKDATGIIPGKTRLTIEDGKYLEIVTPSAVTGNVLTIPPLFFPHEAGVGVTNLPADVKRALLLLVSRLHDSWSMSTGAISHDGTGARRPGGGAARKLCDAGVMLAPYRRVH